MARSRYDTSTVQLAAAPAAGISLMIPIVGRLFVSFSYSAGTLRTGPNERHRVVETIVLDRLVTESITLKVAVLLNTHHFDRYRIVVARSRANGHRLEGKFLSIIQNLPTASIAANKKRNTPVGNSQPLIT